MAVPVSRLERLEDELVYGKLLSVSDSVSDSESGSDNTWIRALDDVPTAISGAQESLCNQMTADSDRDGRATLDLNVARMRK